LYTRKEKYYLGKLNLKTPKNMAYHEQEVKEYKIVHWDNYGKEQLRLECYVKGGLVGVLHFVDEGEDKVPKYVNRVIYLMYGVDQFSNIINTFRFEKPIFIFYNDSDGSPFGGVKTSHNEPVGEEES
jgi:hypothetical protein